jgi:hypothetical protein
MIRVLCTTSFALIAGMVTGCADDPYPGRQQAAFPEKPQQSAHQPRFDEPGPASGPACDNTPAGCR